MNGSSEKIETIDLPGITIAGRPGTDVVTIAGAAKHWHSEYQKAHLRGLVRGVTIGTAFWFAVQIVTHLVKVYHG